MTCKRCLENLHRMKLTAKPVHIPEGWWWMKDGKIYFTEMKP